MVWGGRQEGLKTGEREGGLKWKRELTKETRRLVAVTFQGHHFSKVGAFSPAVTGGVGSGPEIDGGWAGFHQSSVEKPKTSLLIKIKHRT